MIVKLWTLSVVGKSNHFIKKLLKQNISCELSKECCCDGYSSALRAGNLVASFEPPRLCKVKFLMWEHILFDINYREYLEHSLHLNLKIRDFQDETLCKQQIWSLRL